VTGEGRNPGGSNKNQTLLCESERKKKDRSRDDEE